MKTPWYRDSFWLSVGLAMVLSLLAALRAITLPPPGPNSGFITLFLVNIQLVAALVVLKRRIENLEAILTNESPLGRQKRQQVGLPDINPLPPAKAE